MKTYKIYLLRKGLKEKTIKIDSEAGKFLTRFALEREINNIRDRLIRMKKKGLINSISIPGKTVAADLVKSRRSLIKVLRELRNN